MRTALIVASVLSAQVAFAQPVTRPEREPCRVTIVLAPEDVRAEIESWVRAEPRCERELEVRVVPTDDGLYLSARDLLGHVRERVVPDAQSAAVLVVSWMADDSLGTNFPEHSLLEPPAPRASAPAFAADDEVPFEVMSPGLMRSDVRRGASAPRAARWLSLGAIKSSGDRVGVRGQVDLLGGRRWSIGIAGGWTHGDERGAGDDHGTGQARLLLGTSRSFGRVSVRAQLGFGADVGPAGDRMDGRDAMDGARDGGGHAELVPKAEAGVFANLRLTDRWGLIGGPVVDAALGTGGPPTLSIFLGVQRGL